MCLVVRFHKFLNQPIPIEKTQHFVGMMRTQVSLTKFSMFILAITWLVYTFALQRARRFFLGKTYDVGVGYTVCYIWAMLIFGFFESVK